MQTSECQECPLSTTVGSDERQHPGQLHKQVQHLGERYSPLCGGLSSFCKPSIHTKWHLTQSIQPLMAKLYSSCSQWKSSQQGGGTILPFSAVMSSLVVYWWGVSMRLGGCGFEPLLGRTKDRLVLFLTLGDIGGWGGIYQYLSVTLLAH